MAPGGWLASAMRQVSVSRRPPVAHHRPVVPSRHCPRNAGRAPRARRPSRRAESAATAESVPVAPSTATAEFEKPPSTCSAATTARPRLGVAPALKSAVVDSGLTPSHVARGPAARWRTACGRPSLRDGREARPRVVVTDWRQSAWSRSASPPRRPAGFGSHISAGRDLGGQRNRPLRTLHAVGAGPGLPVHVAVPSLSSARRSSRNAPPPRGGWQTGPLLARPPDRARSHLWNPPRQSVSAATPAVDPELTVA